MKEKIVKATKEFVIIMIFGFPIGFTIWFLGQKKHEKHFNENETRITTGVVVKCESCFKGSSCIYVKYISDANQAYVREFSGIYSCKHNPINREVKIEYLVNDPADCRVIVKEKPYYPITDPKKKGDYRVK
jgi:hypothetical protein